MNDMDALRQETEQLKNAIRVIYNKINQLNCHICTLIRKHLQFSGSQVKCTEQSEIACTNMEVLTFQLTNVNTFLPVKL